MRRVCAGFILFFALITHIFSVAPVYGGNADSAAIPPPSLMSEAAILIDAATANILYEKNIHQRMFPASITKVMTAVLAVEFGNLSDMITVSHSALNNLPYDGSNMALKEGEELTLDSLLKGLMVASANDAANVIAEYISGDIPTFVELMNSRSKELGAQNTHYVNPTGLHDENHYTTAYDIAMLCRYAMTIPKIRDTVDIAHIFIQETNLVSYRRYFVNTNSLISRMNETKYYYAPTIGIKTGHTSQAGYCLTAAAGKNMPYELISVTLKAPVQDNLTYSFVDTKKLFEYGYSNFQQILVARPGEIMGEVKVKYGKNNDHISLHAEADTQILIPKSEIIDNVEKKVDIPPSVRAPIAKGQKIGSIIYIYKGVTLGKVTLLSDAEVKRRSLWFIPEFFEYLWSFALVRIFIYVLAGMLVIYIIVVIAGIRNAVKRTKR